MNTFFEKLNRTTRRNVTREPALTSRDLKMALHDGHVLLGMKGAGFHVKLTTAEARALAYEILQSVHAIETEPQS